MPPAHIVSGHFQSLVARVRHAGGAVSETLLLWLALRQLIDSITALFTAWKSGELPPMPAPAALPPAEPRPRAKPAAPQRVTAPSRARRIRARRAIIRAAAALASSHRPRQPSHRPRAAQPRPTTAPPPQPATFRQKANFLTGENCALNITKTK